MKLSTIFEAVERGYDATVTVKAGTKLPWHIELSGGQTRDVATFVVAKQWLTKQGMVHVRDDGQCWYFRKDNTLASK